MYKEEIISEGPKLISYEKTADGVEFIFDTQDGQPLEIACGDSVNEFETAKADGVFYPAKAEIEDTKVKVFGEDEIQGNVVGAIWVRIMNDYGHIDSDTPSLAMSVYQKYRGLGIGTSLLKELLQLERLPGYSKISLSVQTRNYAVKIYKKVGFTVVDENSEEYIMVVNL